MTRKSGALKTEHWRNYGLAHWLRLAIGMRLLLGALAPIWAQEATTNDEFSAHIQRADLLLQSDKPSEALGELDAAFAIRQEPRVLYLQGLTQQKLGNNQQALLLWERFLVAASVASCCVEDRRNASLRIVELRHSLSAAALAGGPTAEALAKLALQPKGDERDSASPEKTQATDEYDVHVQRGEQLLQSGKPSEALRELDAAFSMRQESRVLYLLGLGRQALGLNREAFVLFQRFIVAAAGQCCADERADASLRIAKLRPLYGSFDLAATSPARSGPQPPIGALSRQAHDNELPKVRTNSKTSSSGLILWIVIPSVLAIGLGALGAYGLSQIHIDINFGRPCPGPRDCF